MDLIIRHDIWEIMANTESVNQALEIFEKDHAAWARKCEGKKCLILEIQ